jgi:hypothetical protein
MRGRFVLGFVVALAVGAPVAAQGPGRDPGPCRADVEKHCAGVERGGGGLGRCLREHQAELTPACRDHLAARHEKMRARAEAVFAACESDLAKHCPGKEPGEGGLMRCLRDHESDLTQPCKDALPERQHRGRGR